MRRTPRETGDVPGHGRVGHVDDPVPPSEYGADEEEIQDIQRDALGDVEEARRHARIYHLGDGAPERVRELTASPEETTLSVSDLLEHFRLAAEDDVLDLRDLWQRWHRDGEGESQPLAEAQERSLSVGDVVVLDGDVYRRTREEWTSIELREVESE